MPLFNSDATRFATVTAATRRGCVMPTIFPCAPSSFAACKNLGSCVLFPLPVAPHITNTSCALKSFRNFFRTLYTGSPAVAADGSADADVAADAVSDAALIWRDIASVNDVS